MVRGCGGDGEQRRAGEPTPAERCTCRGCQRWPSHPRSPLHAPTPTPARRTLLAATSMRAAESTQNEGMPFCSPISCGAHHGLKGAQGGSGRAEGEWRGRGRGWARERQPAEPAGRLPHPPAARALQLPAPTCRWLVLEELKPPTTSMRSMPAGVPCCPVRSYTASWRSCSAQSSAGERLEAGRGERAAGCATPHRAAGGPSPGRPAQHGVHTCARQPPRHCTAQHSRQQAVQERTCVASQMVSITMKRWLSSAGPYFCSCVRSSILPISSVSPCSRARHTICM